MTKVIISWRVPKMVDLALSSIANEHQRTKGFMFEYAILYYEHVSCRGLMSVSDRTSFSYELVCGAFCCADKLVYDAGEVNSTLYIDKQCKDKFEEMRVMSLLSRHAFASVVVKCYYKYMLQFSVHATNPDYNNNVKKLEDCFLILSENVSDIYNFVHASKLSRADAFQNFTVESKSNPDSKCELPLVMTYALTHMSQHFNKSKRFIIQDSIVFYEQNYFRFLEPYDEIDNFTRKLPFSVLSYVSKFKYFEKTRLFETHLDDVERDKLKIMSDRLNLTQSAFIMLAIQKYYAYVSRQVLHLIDSKYTKLLDELDKNIANIKQAMYDLYEAKYGPHPSGSNQAFVVRTKEEVMALPRPSSSLALPEK